MPNKLLKHQGSCSFHHYSVEFCNAETTRVTKMGTIAIGWLCHFAVVFWFVLVQPSRHLASFTKTPKEWFFACMIMDSRFNSSPNYLFLQFSIENTSSEKLATCVWLLVPWPLQSRQMQISFAFPKTLCSRHTCTEHDTQSIISFTSRPSAANKELRNNCGFVWRLCSCFWKSWQHNEEQVTNVTILSSS